MAVFATQRSEPARPTLDGAAPTHAFRSAALRRLDHLLTAAITAAGDPAGEALPPVAMDAAPGWMEILESDRGWRWLRDAYTLSARELDLVLLALAPDADARYQRVYGYLLDDLTRIRPSVDLALGLLSTGADDKLAARRLLAADAPLLRGRVLTLVTEPGVPRPPLPALPIAVDEQIADLLLGAFGLDRRLAPVCHLTTPPHGDPGEVPAPLARAVADAWGERPLRLYLHGPVADARATTVRALAGELDLPLLTTSLTALPPPDTRLADLLPVLFREAWLHGALLYLDDLDELQCDERRRCRELLGRHLLEHPGVTILGGRGDWQPLGSEPLGVVVLPVPGPDFTARRGIWAGTLAGHGIRLAPADLDRLADRFRLAGTQIRDAVHAAADGAACHDPEGTGQPSAADLFTAARAHTGHGLAELARKVTPVHGWADLVLPDDSLAQLREICRRVTLRRRVLDDWDFGARLSRGRGVSALFAGPPGTGKTMAAEVVAGALDCDLHTVDLASVISKYIGETEKNLERVFTAAADADAVLFFDEADALFGKRSEVRDAHDRYANVEIAYLLQRMEQYDGLAILATNLREHLDDAFTRRLQFVVDFPFPGEDDRLRIWRVCLPAAAPYDPAIDFAGLATRFRLSGANIQNIVLAAAFLAAHADCPIRLEHLLTAIGRELRKMGRLVSEEELRSGGAS